MSLHNHKKVIQFTLTNMLTFEEKIIEEKWKEFKTQTPEKWNYWESISLQNLLSAHHCIPLLHMDKRMTVYVVNNKKIEQFQVIYMSYTGLNQNKAFKDQVETFWAWHLTILQWLLPENSWIKITLMFFQFWFFMKT